MEITISDNRKIFDASEEFSQLFPYLKLKFSAAGKAPVKKSGRLTVSPDMTVTDVEQGFYNSFGLDVHVLRKSGRAWLETTLTCSWTLEEQNRQGEALSRPVC